MKGARTFMLIQAPHDSAELKKENQMDSVEKPSGEELTDWERIIIERLHHPNKPLGPGERVVTVDKKLVWAPPGEIILLRPGDKIVVRDA